MKHLVYLTLLGLALTSCGKYQINTISSATLNKDPNTGVLTTSNDSFDISYQFRGKNAPLTIEILNKMKEPVTVDWSKCALIVDSAATSFLGDKIGFGGSSVGSSWKFSRDWEISSHDFAGAASVPTALTFIPPGTRVRKTILTASNKYVNNIPPSALTTIKSGIEESQITVKFAEFNQSNSPVKFQSYLTFFTENEGKKHYISRKHDFYISKLIVSPVDPTSTEFYPRDRSDVYYLHSGDGRGTRTNNPEILPSGFSAN